MDSITAAAWIARLAFPVLLMLGLVRGEIGYKGTLVFVALGLGAWVGLPRAFSNGSDSVTSALAMIDIALVFVVFKGDVRLG